MKKLVFVCAFVMGISAVSFAQGGGRQTPEQQLTRLKSQVAGITDDQSAKLMAIYVSQAKSRDSLMTAAGDDRSVMMQGYMKILPVTDAKIKAVLTADQAATYQKAIVDVRNERMKQMQQGGN